MTFVIVNDIISLVLLACSGFILRAALRRLAEANRLLAEARQWRGSVTGFRLNPNDQIVAAERQELQ